MQDLINQNRKCHKYHHWKITKRIESYKVLDVTDNELAIHLLLNIKYTVIVADTGSPILTNPDSTSLVFCETNVRYFQYNTKAATDHYL